MEGLLSAKNSTLCFNKDDFLVKGFSVDQFVSHCRKYVSLETMLEDLGLYHKILCCSMIELINKDYADFVNLSSNLVGLDKTIKNLSLPLEKQKVEVEKMKCSLDETLNSAKTKFTMYAAVYRNKVLAHHVLSVLEGLKKIEDLNSLIERDEESIPSDLVERIALEYNSVQFHMGKIREEKVITEKKKWNVYEAASTLKHHLEKLFLQSLFSRNETHSLTKVLRIFSVINEQREVEAFFANNVVKPYFEKHLTEENVVKHGLPKVYNDILDFIAKYCLNILDVTRGTRGKFEMVPGYDFLVNAVWPEVVISFDLISLVHLYAPGDPKLFHANYSASILFLDQFEHYCEVQTSVQRFRNSPSYKTFMEKWNLDVYFQIRFQEIAGSLENSFLQSFIYIKPKEAGIENERTCKYLLNASASVSQCLHLCWNKKIFLDALSYNFWRLSLQLLSRYRKWAYNVLNCKEDEYKNLTPVQAAVIIRDVEHLVIELKLFFKENICLKISKDIIEAAFQESIKSLEGIIPLASTFIIEGLSRQCCSHLKIISDIPRLFRKTNREIPTKPSSYVSVVFNSLKAFLSETDSVLPEKLKRVCLEEVTNGIITESLAIIEDVLTSIKKMENSLKILKRARDKPLEDKKRGDRGTTHTVSSGIITDDDKIKRQLAIDINFLEENVRMLGIEIDNMKSFKELKALMNSCEKNILQNC